MRTNMVCYQSLQSVFLFLLQPILFSFVHEKYQELIVYGEVIPKWEWKDKNGQDLKGISRETT
jgi:hypothetical protein